MNVLFIEAPAFTREIERYLDDDEFARFQEALARDPESGSVIRGTGGFRKIRWRDPRRRKGTRGGLRVIYYYFRDDQEIWLMTIYDKNEATDLTAQQKALLRAAIDAEREARSNARRGRR